MPEFKELVARYWPEGAGLALAVTILVKYVLPKTTAAVKRLWAIHVGFDARIARLEAEARGLRDQFQRLDDQRETMTVGAASLASKVDGLVLRFEDVRKIMSDDLRDLRDETRETLKRTDALVCALADLVRNIRADHVGYAEALRESDERLRQALREELARARGDAQW